MINILKRSLLKSKNNNFIKRYDSGKTFSKIYDENNPKEASKLSSIDIVNHETEKTYFKSFSEIGFTLSNNFKVIGACTALPNIILFWNVLNIEDVTEESLDLISVIYPKLDIVIIGKGPRNAKPDVKLLLEISRKLKINFEILPTAEALSTFNFLNYEDRNVAAFLLPAKNFSYLDEEKEEIMRLRNKRLDLIKDSESDLTLNIENKVLNTDFLFPGGVYGRVNKIGEEMKKIDEEMKQQLIERSKDDEKIKKIDERLKEQSIENPKDNKKLK